MSTGDDLTHSAQEKKVEGYIGLIKRNKAIFEHAVGGVTLVEFDNIDVDGAPMVDAFPSTGVISVLAGMQLVKTMSLPLVGVLTSPQITACCTMQCEQPSHPARIFGNKNIVIFICEFPLAEEIVSDVVEIVYDFARRHRSRMIFTVEGMPTGDIIKLPSGEEVSLSREEEENGEEEIKTFIDDKAEEESKEALALRLYGDKLHYATTDSALAAKLRDMGYIPIVDGVIVGVAGGILAKAPLTDQEVTAILAPSGTVLPSADSAIAVLKLLSALIPNISISTSELEKMRDELEEVKKSILKAIPAQHQTPPSLLYT